MALPNETRISVEGVRVERGPTDPAGITRGGATRRHDFDLRPVAEFDLGAARGGTTKRPEAAIPANGVVELEFEDGFRVFTVADAIPRDFGSVSGKAIDRGTAPTAGGGGAPGSSGPLLEIPRQLVPRRRAVDKRGTLGWVLRRLKIFDSAAERGAESLCTNYEDSIARKQGVDQLNVLCRLGLDKETRLDPITGQLGPQEGPLLLFLHGTASSTRGSFGRLWDEGDTAARGVLQRRYGNRIFGFEHRTMTESPVRNALDLVRQLPERSVLHVVSHSRGGLVGELLCRGERVQDGAGTEVPFSKGEIEQYLKRLEDQLGGGSGASDSLRIHHQDLENLSGELARRKIKVERFARIACPARGTTLASDRFDLFLSAIANILEHLPGFAADAAALFADLARALVAQRANPRVLPGLEAMMPDSALVWLLNHRAVRVRSDLAVIAGDIEGNGILGRLAVYLTDLFFRGQHDLVVDTDFMTGGARRTGDTWRYFVQGVDVSHFGYFGAGRARTALIEALDRAGSTPKGFEVFDPELKGSRDGATRGIPGLWPGGSTFRDRRILTAADDLDPARPVVFLLPGIMGSHLQNREGRIWVNHSRLFDGAFGSLNADATDVRPDGVIDDYYARLSLHLGESMQVIEWPFDWRLAVADSAARLADDVQTVLRKIGEMTPVRFVGHSMGGLVVRALALDHHRTWESVCEREGARFLMLGTPNRGTWSAVQLLIGRDDVTSKLAFADVSHSHRELLALVRRFPGVLDLLPHGDDALYQPDLWQTWHDHDSQYLVGRVIWKAPEKEALARAGRYASQLDAQLVAWGDPGLRAKMHFGYVAGSADLTPHGISTKGALEVVGSSGGDGRVRWDSAFSEADRTWLKCFHVPAAHGDLPAHEAAFQGIAEWLDKGETSGLSTVLPALRGDEVELPILPFPESSRSDAALAALAVGSTSRRHRDEGFFTPQVRDVSVVHAHLREASHDLLLGHYRGVDSLMNAEVEVDEIMRGALTQALALRQFPGDLNRSRLFVKPDSLRVGARAENAARGGVEKPALAHAIVTGLGTPGELTPETLRETVLNALLSYALRQLELASVLGTRKDGQPLRLGLSSTLIGTSTSMVTVEDAVVSIVGAAADANRRLNEAGHPLSFDCIEFVELWQDQAIEAVRALQRAKRAFRLDTGIRLPTEVIDGEGGQSREGAFDESKWWSRLRIASTAAGASAASRGNLGELKFTLHTDRARLESRLLGTQRRQIDRFVEDAIASRPPPEGVAETLYQLLLPNELKGDALQGRRLVLLVDEQSAGYPWELLKGNGEASRAAPALSGGIVRQLDLEFFRERGDLVTNGLAYVVGDPLLDTDGRKDGPNQLPGALAEAQRVEALLTEARIPVTPMIQARGSDIIRHLMRARFQILHLAGHGQYQADAEGNLVTGMLLGDGWYLTANEIGQMPGIPELVFVNCCHLGRPDSTIVGASMAEPHRFAASLSTQLMKIGVRCVVAAGWAIDDDAALTFADAFYQAFVGDRESFGESVRKARLRCHTSHPQSNTWAAFQCYGDPQFCLSWTREDRDDKAVQRTVREYVSAAEVISHLANIPLGSHKETLERSLQRIEQIEAQIRPPWRRRGDVMAALGDAYRRARNYKAAIGCYENALAASGGNPGLSALERIEDLKGLDATETFLDDLESRRDLTLRGDLKDVVETLGWMAKAAPSPTRLVMYAWACKRAIILIRDPSKRDALLDAMRTACLTVLNLLRSEELGRRGDSRLRRIESAAILMEVAASTALGREAESKGLAGRGIDQAEASAAELSWEALNERCVAWARDVDKPGPGGRAAVFKARDAVSVEFDRFADSPRLWSIAREHWWFCQILRESQASGPGPRNGGGGGKARVDGAGAEAEVGAEAGAEAKVGAEAAILAAPGLRREPGGEFTSSPALQPGGKPGVPGKAAALEETKGNGSGPPSKKAAQQATGAGAGKTGSRRTSTPNGPSTHGSAGKRRSGSPTGPAPEKAAKATRGRNQARGRGPRP